MVNIYEGKANIMLRAASTFCIKLNYVNINLQELQEYRNTSFLQYIEKYGTYIYVTTTL